MLRGARAVARLGRLRTAAEASWLTAFQILVSSRSHSTRVLSREARMECETEQLKAFDDDDDGLLDEHT